MRPCEPEPLTLKPFAADTRVCLVGEDHVVREASLGGAGRFESLPALTLFLPAGSSYPVGAKLTVNLLPSTRRADASLHFEDSQQVPAPLIAESRVAFECIVLATGSLEGAHAEHALVVARVLLAHQRWPRGCATS
jgi:hypothetical protein